MVWINVYNIDISKQLKAIGYDWWSHNGDEDVFFVPVHALELLPESGWEFRRFS